MAVDDKQMSSGTVLIDNAHYYPIDRILFKQEIDSLMVNPHFFSEQSRVNVFEIKRSGGSLLPVLDEDTIVKYLASMGVGRNADVAGRIIFVGGHKASSDRINATADTLKVLCDSLSISSTFMACIPRQQMPGATLLQHPRSRQSLRHDMWYSLISRNRDKRPPNAAEQRRRESFPVHYASKSVIDWSRMNVWASYDEFNHQITALVLRCPDDLMRSFVNTFSGQKGTLLLQHPTLMHAYFCSDYLSRSYDFLREFSASMYDLENGSKKTVDATKRSQQFLNINREVSQVATDYKVMREAIKMLRKEHLRLQELIGTANILLADEAQLSVETIYYLNDEIFDQFLSQTEMIQTYSDLYVRRATIGMNEGFALANQRDADINIKVAQAAYRDGKALQSIQYLTMLFLPPSLAASIFGMGFFSTDRDAEGRVTFSISHQWWIFLAVSGCLLIGMALTMLFLWAKGRQYLRSTTVEEKV